MSASQPVRNASPSTDALEPLTDEQRAAVRRWREGGTVDSPEVAALRKKARGEALTDAERALLARVARKPSGGGTPISQEQMTALLDERKRRGE
jgi:hypothetical protein